MPGRSGFQLSLRASSFQQKRYPESARWIEKSLRLDPHDEYANDFAGTVFLLMGNLDAALKYWNRIQKPPIDDLELDPQLNIQRLLLERAFVFSPQAVMQRPDFASSEARLDGLGVFPAYSITLDARPDGKFDAEFHAIERNGFGNGWLQSLVSVFSGLPYATIYPGYFNIGRSATNFDSLVRWDAQKRRVWLSLSGPLRYLPQWRWQLAADGRDENGRFVIRLGERRRSGLVQAEARSCERNAYVNSQRTVRVDIRRGAFSSDVWRRHRWFGVDRGTGGARI